MTDSLPVDPGHPWLIAHRRYLRDHRPRLFAELVEDGSLDQFCQEATARAIAWHAEMIEAGELPEVAMELVRHDILFPTSEEEHEVCLTMAHRDRLNAQDSLASLVGDALAR